MSRAARRIKREEWRRGERRDGGGGPVGAPLAGARRPAAASDRAGGGRRGDRGTGRKGPYRHPAAPDDTSPGGGGMGRTAGRRVDDIGPRGGGDTSWRREQPATRMSWRTSVATLTTSSWRRRSRRTCVCCVGVAIRILFQKQGDAGECGSRDQCAHSARLAAMPLAGLLRDGPPTARLWKNRAAFLCHRQRRSAFLAMTVLGDQLRVCGRGPKGLAARRKPSPYGGGEARAPGLRNAGSAQKRRKNGAYRENCTETGARGIFLRQDVA